MTSSQRRHGLVPIYGKIALFFGISALCGVLVAGFFLPWASTGGTMAQAGNQILDEHPAELDEASIGVPSRILASDGTEIATFYAENRQPVEIEEMAEDLQHAVVAIEDERFYDHHGTDLRGIARAAAANITSDTTQGASTITHQYVSQLILNADQLAGEEELAMSGTTTVADRLNEARIAVDLEEEMSKDEILAGYLNIVLLGGRNYGVEAAAQYLWGIPAAELDLAQSALLAGLIQNPNGLNPEENPDGALQRRGAVLEAMLRNDYITEDERDEAAAQELALDIHPRSAGCQAAEVGPYVCDYVVRSIQGDDAFGETVEEREALLNRGGLEIQTTLDATLQQEADAQVAQTVPADDPSGAGASLVTVEPGTGSILAMAQNTEYATADRAGATTLNFNVDQNMGGGNGFQAGSTLKPFVAATWIDAGNSMTDTVDASRDEYEQGATFDASCQPGGEVAIPDEDGWSIGNAIEDMTKEMTVDYGLYWSINTATVATLAELDVCDVTELTTDLGIHRADDGEPLNPAHPSFVLGAEEISPLTQASAFAAFAADGQYCRPRILSEVTDAEGTSYEVPAEECSQALDSDTVAQLNETLGLIAEERVAEGDAEFPIAGKTGTNNNESSTWFIGYTSGLATASWVGSYTGLTSLAGVPINGTAHEDFWGSTLAAPQWLDYMNAVGEDYSTDEFTAPEDSDFDDVDDPDRYDLDHDGAE